MHGLREVDSLSSEGKGHGGQVGAPALTVRKPLVNTDLTWCSSGACNSSNTDAFFPAMNDIDAVNAAKAVCAICPVITDCREYAMDNDIEFGIWGGMTPGERAGMRARRELHASD